MDGQTTGMQGVAVVDVSQTGITRFSGHLYNAAVIEDIKLILGNSNQRTANFERHAFGQGNQWRLVPRSRL